MLTDGNDPVETEKLMMMIPERKGSAAGVKCSHRYKGGGGMQGAGAGAAAQTGLPGHRMGEGAQVHLEKLGRCGAQRRGTTSC